MKAAILFLSLLPMAAFAAKGDITPGPNQCASVMDSKVYVTSDFHDYPRKVVFDCTYKCNANGKIDQIVGRTSVTVNNMQDDATGTVCQGLLMKTVPWGYDFDKLTPFYAPDTEIVAIKKWALKNINFNPVVNPLEKQRLLKLKTDLNQISSSLIVAGMQNSADFAYMKEAGIKISEIAEGLPEDTRLLDEVIELIIANKGVWPVPRTAESMMLPTVSNAASWRIPTYLFR